MAEQTATFTVPMAARITKAVRAVERAGLTMPQLREPEAPRLSQKQWLGKITASSGGGSYTVERARVVGGVVTAYAATAPQYLSVTATHMETLLATEASEGEEALPDLAVGTPVMVMEFQDAAIDNVVSGRVCYFWTSRVGQPAAGDGVYPARITSSTAVIAGAKWSYKIKIGAYVSGVFTVDSSAVELDAVNTIENDNASAESTGGDGVPLPPEVGSLTRLPVANTVVLVTRLEPNLYGFCVPNPFESSCSESEE